MQPFLVPDFPRETGAARNSNSSEGIGSSSPRQWQSAQRTSPHHCYTITVAEHHPKSPPLSRCAHRHRHGRAALRRTCIPSQGCHRRNNQVHTRNRHRGSLHLQRAEHPDQAECGRSWSLYADGRDNRCFRYAHAQSSRRWKGNGVERGLMWTCSCRGRSLRIHQMRICQPKAKGRHMERGGRGLLFREHAGSELYVEPTNTPI